MSNGANGQAAEADDPDLEDLLAFIRDSRGFDFTSYKRSTLTRRIRKRMHDGRSIACSVSCSPLHDPSGCVVLLMEEAP
jgi:hypothetical protein